MQTSFAFFSWSQSMPWSVSRLTCSGYISHWVYPLLELTASLYRTTPRLYCSSATGTNRRYWLRSSIFSSPIFLRRPMSRRQFSLKRGCRDRPTERPGAKERKCASGWCRCPSLKPNLRWLMPHQMIFAFSDMTNFLGRNVFPADDEVGCTAILCYQTNVRVTCYGAWPFDGLTSST